MASTTAQSQQGQGQPTTPFGPLMRREHFFFSPAYTPLNHGSYGTYPRSVRAAHLVVQEECEAAPDAFIVIKWAERLRAARGRVAQILGIPTSTSETEDRTDELVFVPNATTGIDTVLKNLKWAKGDVILVYEFCYDSVRGGLQWAVETFGVRVEVVALDVPMGDDAVVQAMVGAARRVNSNSNAENGNAKERVRLAIIDAVVSMPGFRVPFERLVPALQAEGALVLVDAAHGIGHVEIDIEALKPDFLVTNLHKWFFVPRAAAALYVPRRHQALIRTSLPTSYLFRRLGNEGGGNAFVELFDFTATMDTTNYLTIDAAITFRNETCGGEAAITSYCRALARDSAAIVASIFGTEVMDVSDSGSYSCMRDCNFANVRLPLEISDSDSGSSESGSLGIIKPSDAKKVTLWFKRTGVEESGMYFQCCVYRGQFWWRLSAMVYLDVEDFRKGAEVLRGLCGRAGRGEWVG
ncbi:putative aminotransferase family protein [Astrocystis sublimbata]|nr:putative aminotransferase family protein [Astrocystis sublimbata]